MRTGEQIRKERDKSPLKFPWDTKEHVDYNTAFNTALTLLSGVDKSVRNNTGFRSALDWFLESE